ncbi:MAG: hypothetical protein J0I21_17155 [Alphaproteobacteria bacterium]|nr:hypothetical protein [Alphaproteobacteria bacterium]
MPPLPPHPLPPTALAAAGFVTGLAAEARIAAPLGHARAGGGTGAGAEAVAEAIVREGVSALVSFGLCGGLDPALRPGAIVIAQRVLSDGESFAADAGWSRMLGGTTATLLAAESGVVTSAAAKAALFARTGAAAVDLESGAVARVAARHGLPFAVLRAVCDPAAMTLPRLALDALDADGRIHAGRVAWALLRAPGDLPRLAHLARAAVLARAALRARVAAIRAPA